MSRDSIIEPNFKIPEGYVQKYEFHGDRGACRISTIPGQGIKMENTGYMNHLELYNCLNWIRVTIENIRFECKKVA